MKDETGDPLLDAFDQHYPSIFSYLVRRVGHDIGEDLASEVFAVAFRKRSAFDSSKGTFVGWLFGIASNLVRNSQRAEERRLRAYTRHGETAADSEAFERAEERLDLPAERERLAEALIRLKPMHREVLTLVAWSELTYAEIGEALDIPVGTVRSRLSRAREEMRELLASSDGEGATNKTEDMRWIG